jgi:hypothetical protein
MTDDKMTEAMVAHLLRLILKANAQGMLPPYSFVFSSPNGTTLSGMASEDLAKTEFFDDGDKDFDLPIKLDLTDAVGRVLSVEMVRRN